jgi:hypothetical protein
MIDLRKWCKCLLKSGVECVKSSAVCCHNLYSIGQEQIVPNRTVHRYKPIVVEDNVRHQSAVFQDLSGTRLMVSDTLTGANCSKQLQLTFINYWYLSVMITANFEIICTCTSAKAENFEWIPSSFRVCWIVSLSDVQDDRRRSLVWRGLWPVWGHWKVSSLFLILRISQI